MDTGAVNEIASEFSFRSLGTACSVYSKRCDVLSPESDCGHYDQRDIAVRSQNANNFNLMNRPRMLGMQKIKALRKLA